MQPRATGNVALPQPILKALPVSQNRVYPYHWTSPFTTLCEAVYVFFPHPPQLVKGRKGVESQKFVSYDAAMYRPRKLARLVSEICRQRGLTAAQASRVARLSTNQVRHIQRGLHRPTPRVVEALIAGLNVDADTASMVRRLAGLTPDPGAAPGAKVARSEAWPLLLYVLANHVLLPQLGLLDAVEHKSRLSLEERDLLRRAAAAPDIATFASHVAASPPPPAALRRLIDDTFWDAPLDAIRALRQDVRNELDCRRPQGPALPFGVPYRWNQRWAIARVLMGHNRPAFPEVQLYDFIRLGAFDYNFAVCLFPAVYWHACQAWPFDKIAISEGRPSLNVQRRLYDAVCSGLPLPDFAGLLAGRGELSVELAGFPPVRPSPEDADARKPGWVKLVLRGRGRTHELIGPRPPTDALFDHLDRCAFLDRFPLIKIDRQGFADLARSLNLPTWDAWTHYLSQHSRLPEDAPPRTPDRFAFIVFDWKIGDAGEHDPATLDSYVLRRLVDEVSDGAARLIGNADWPAVLRVAEALNVRPEWLRVARALANRQRQLPEHVSGSAGTNATPDRYT